MSNTTIPVPSLEDLRKISRNDRYDYEVLREYYALTNYKKKNGFDLQLNRISPQILRDYADNAGFKDWLSSNFVENPGWLKLFFSNDSTYRPIISSSGGSYIEFDTSELLSGGPFQDTYLVEGDDIVYGYKKHSLKEELASTGKDGINGKLEKTTNGKWRIYLNVSGATSDSAANTTSTNSNTSTISSTDSTSNTGRSGAFKAAEDSLKKLHTKLNTGLSTSTNTSSTTNTDSTTTSFDFIDDILGTKSSSDLTNGTTDYDINAIVNNSINNSSNLNQIKTNTVSELVANYTEAMNSILSNYGDKDIYSLY